MSEVRLSVERKVGRHRLKAAKPPYTVPTMKEVAALPWNGLRVASTFSGGGGSCTGYRMAGYRVVYANEFIPAAQETYKANHPDSFLDTRDIRTVSAADVLKATGLSEGELDLFDGSPPCSAFSTAGKREKGWGKAKSYSDDAKQVVDDLFYEYARILRGVQPKVFVAENVSGLVKGTAKGYFLNILAELKSCGYVVGAKLLNSAWLGVPQSRERLIFVGVRRDLGMEPAFPKPLPYSYTLRDAIPLDGSMPVEPESSMGHYAVGAEWKKIPVGGQSEKYFQLCRAHPDKPVGTITAAGGSASAASVSHPFECRKFSIAELRRLCSFPDDYVLAGDYAQQYERMGRSVPPIMMRSVAEAVASNILLRS